MSIRRLHFVPLLWVLVLSLLASPARPFGYVWCLGEDGHATMETARAGNCDGDAAALPAENLAAPALTGAADNCGACLDISPAPRWGTARVRTIDASKALPDAHVPALVGHHDRPAWFLNEQPRTDSPPRPPATLRHHRTIVLQV